MTLAELRVFITEMDQAGAAENTPVGARVSWGGGLKRITASARRFGDPEDARGRRAEGQGFAP
jgi:hypothetical protein